MKIKKLIPLLLAAVCLTACAQIPPVKETVPPEQQKIIAPPDEGWTADELMSVAYLNGIQLEYPLTLRSMGSGVSLTDTEFFSDNEDSTSYILCDADDSSSLLLGTLLADVDFGKEYSQITVDDPAVNIIFYNEFFSVNGIKKESSADDVIKAFGEPDMITENEYRRKIYSYNDSKSGDEFMTVVLNDDKVLTIEVKL